MDESETFPRRAAEHHVGANRWLAFARRGRSTCRRVAEKLRGHGYIVLFVDYLGRRGARNCSRGLITEGDAAKDLVTAVTWLRSQPAVDRARISALGWSYGGGAVLVALAEN